MAAPNHMRLALTGTCATAAAGATGAAATAPAGATCGAMGVTGVTGATAGGAWLPEGAAPPKGDILWEFNSLLQKINEHHH